MRNRIIVVLLIMLSLAPPISSQESKDVFATYILKWRDKNEVASKYLQQAEKELKSGLRSKACISQRIASKNGIEALNALNKAYQIYNMEPIDINIAESMERWDRLSNCSN